MSHRKHLHWNIADWCNYACSYCCEGRYKPNPSDRRFADEALVGAALRFFSTLEAGWRIRLSAGEPSTHPKLFELARAIAALGHRPCIETNLSLALERYEGFIEAASGRVGYIHASYHREFADASEFLSKCVALKRRLGPDAGFWAAAVAQRENLESLKETALRFRDQGIELNVQLDFGERWRERPKAVEPFLEPSARHRLDAGFKEASAELAPAEPRRRMPTGRFVGQPCLAGAQWLLLDFKGDVWRCHSAKSSGISRPLGSVLSGPIALAAGAEPCVYAGCGCPGQPVV